MTQSTPVLEGFGVRMLPLTLEHAEALNSTHDAATWKFMSESGSTPALLRVFVQRALAAVQAGTCQAWATAVLNDEGQPQIAGCTRLADINWQHRTAEIGWTWVAPEFRGTGLNARVKLLQLRHAFQALNLRRVAFKTHHANMASQRAILKLGAQYEGTFRNHIIMPDGSSRDSLWYSITDAEWPEIQRLLLQRVQAKSLTTRTGGLNRANVE